jgi:hypothetical protein
VVFLVLVGGQHLNELGARCDELLHLVAIDHAGHKAMLATRA